MKNLFKEITVGIIMITVFATFNYYFPLHPVMAFGTGVGIMMGLKYK